MAGLDAFEQEIRVATAGLEPDEIRHALAVYARKSVAEAVQSGRASARYDRYVNGRRGASEDSVQLPGPIVYEFSLWEPILTFALLELARRAPVRSGRFRKSFIVLADQQVVTDFDRIGPNDEVIITNFQPYVRKAESGGLGVPRYSIFDGAKRALARQFGNDGRNSATFRFEARWLRIEAGVHPQIPYHLKRSNGRRKDSQAGMPITYPSIVITQV